MCTARRGPSCASSALFHPLQCPQSCRACRTDGSCHACAYSYRLSGKGCVKVRHCLHAVIFQVTRDCGSVHRKRHAIHAYSLAGAVHATCTYSSSGHALDPVQCEDSSKCVPCTDDIQSRNRPSSPPCQRCSKDGRRCLDCTGMLGLDRQCHRCLDPSCGFCSAGAWGLVQPTGLWCTPWLAWGGWKGQRCKDTQARHVLQLDQPNFPYWSLCRLHHLRVVLQ